jgi:N-acetylglucosaminyl-diphospho-decaprenol L-rhamnosyltransferase
LSLVVVTWNSERELPGLLASVERQLSGPYEVVVVDSASRDETVERARAWEGPLRLLALGQNLGFGAAANQGVREARHEALALLNPDSVLVDGSLPDLAALAVRRDALCGPELLELDGSRQPSASAPPGGWELLLDALVPAALLPEPLRVRCEPWRASATTEVGWLTGACLAAPRETLLRLGPFDERLELYGEDLDLGLRAWRAGVPSLFAPDVARVVHLGERSTARRLGEARAAWKLRARRDVVRRHLGRGRERADYGAQTVFHAGRFAAKRLLGRPAAREAAWLRAARHG